MFFEVDFLENILEISVFFNQNIMINIQKLSDRDLYLICKKWGAAALAARRKFAGLLPEVYAREMAEREKGRSWLKKRGFFSIRPEYMTPT